MRNIKWLSMVTLAGVLAACNPLALIPAQTLADNPMALDGAQIASGTLQPLQVGADLAFATSPFADTDKGQFNGAAPDNILLSIKVKKVLVTGCLTPPDSFGLSLKDVKVRVRNTGAQDGPASTQDPNPVTGTASGKTALTGGLAGFEYALDSTKEIKFGFGRDLFDTVTSGGDNVASIEGKVTADNGLAGCKLSAVVDDHSITLSNFR